MSNIQDDNLSPPAEYDDACGDQDLPSHFKNTLFQISNDIRDQNINCILPVIMLVFPICHLLLQLAVILVFISLDQFNSLYGSKDITNAIKNTAGITNDAGISGRVSVFTPARICK